MYQFAYSSPIGSLLITLSEKGIVGAVFTSKKSSKKQTTSPEALETVCTLQRMLDDYFHHKKPFSNKDLKSLIDIDKLPGTEFQRNVWRAIASIPHGKVIDYSTLTIRAGNPTAVRAVGTACGKNPLALFIPCHRVVRKSGEDYGYSWGPVRKKYLLSHEKIFFKI